MTAQAGDTFSSKSALRRTLRQRRAQIPPSERKRAALAAAQRLCALPAYRRAQRIALYLPHGSELDTLPLLQRCWRDGKTVAVPVAWRPGALLFRVLAADAALRRAAYGIRVPARRSQRLAPRSLDLIVVPLVGFDAAGHRLGAGGGYYDRLLAGLSAQRPLRLGYAFAEQRVDALPLDPWDVALHAVVTPGHTWWRPAGAGFTPPSGRTASGP